MEASSNEGDRSHAGSKESPLESRCPSRVLILPDVILDDKKRDCCVNGVPPTGPVIVTLKHPRTEYGALYLMCSESKRLYELKRFTDSVPRCWLMDNTMIKDGSIHLCTLVDPLLLALPYVKMATENGTFSSLEHILVDSEYPSLINLCDFLTKNQMMNISDVKEHGSDVYYSFKKEKALEWLQGKVSLLVDKLKEMNVNAGQGSKAATLVSSRKEQSSGDDFKKYACGMLVDYLSLDLGFKLYEHLGMTVVGQLGRSISTPQKKRSETLSSGDEDQPPPMKKMYSESQPIEDYSLCNKAPVLGGSNEGKKKKTPGQRALEKIDKTGMKSLNSFFSIKNSRNTK